MADECQRCGFCCTYAQIRMFNDAENRDKIKWFQMHGCRTIEKEEVIRIFIPITCSALVYNGETKKYSCAIYDTRPQICRNYECKKHGNNLGG